MDASSTLDGPPSSAKDAAPALGLSLSDPPNGQPESAPAAGLSSPGLSTPKHNAETEQDNLSHDEVVATTRPSDLFDAQQQPASSYTSPLVPDADPAGPHLAAGDMSDGNENDPSHEAPRPLPELDRPHNSSRPDGRPKTDLAKLETDTHNVLQANATPRARMVVLLPAIPAHKRHLYTSTQSQIIELVSGVDDAGRGQARYRVEFTDGKQDTLSLNQLMSFSNGRTALNLFKGRMDRTKRKRKSSHEDGWGSVAEVSDLESMGLHQDIVDKTQSEADSAVSHPPLPRKRRLRSRLSSIRLASRKITPMSGSDASDTASGWKRISSKRTLRSHQRPRKTISTMMTGRPLHDSDQDELAFDMEDMADNDYHQPTVSNIFFRRRPRTGPLQRDRRSQTRNSRATALSQASSSKSYSDFDSEAAKPRRSLRATRARVSMRDDVISDDEFNFRDSDAAPESQISVSVVETFRSVPIKSAFGLVHINYCRTCGGSRIQDQLVYCQGCSLAFHKPCLGSRSSRSHLATKIGDGDFVLQCRYCIGSHKVKNPTAPRYSMCQVCRHDGPSCAPFSKKQTTRQEEQLREANGGIDPVTSVPAELVNEAKNVLLRCVTCFRAWHFEHLPSGSGKTPATNPEVGRSRNRWRCNDCAEARHEIHRLEAWRPTESFTTQLNSPATFEDVSHDDKEYLIKWKELSYFHCSWMPGAWVYGVASPVTLKAFVRRAREEDLMKLTSAEAIPEEYLMADIIFDVEMKSSAPRARSKEMDLNLLPNVGRFLCKFRGLGYDDVVWDSLPEKDTDEKYYRALRDAYHDYVEGKYFQHQPYGRMRDRIRTFRASKFKAIDRQPSGLERGKLMGYQMEGLNWLLGNYHEGRSIVLADEMGLGKTVQVIGLVTSLVQDEPKCWPFLVVVPNATCQNWRREFKKWAPALRVVTYHGGKQPQDIAYRYELFPDRFNEMKAHVVIMSYDSAQDPTTNRLFKMVHWAGLIVDEGQRLKNDKSLLYSALRAMNIPFRLLLTGTPLQNNKRELFSLLQFIDDTQDAEALDRQYAVLDKENLPELHEKIRPFFLRRTKAAVLKFLPPMAHIILPVSMTVIQEKLSKSIMAKNPQLIQSVFGNRKLRRGERGSLSNILLQLRKCLCHPFIYSSAIEEISDDPSVVHRNLVEASSKLVLLETMLPQLQARGHRVLFFSQFLQQLDILEDFLTKLEYQFVRIDGNVSSLQKQRRIDAFNAPDSPIFAFLLSTRAGGVGINLASADTVIIMDPDFNPHQDLQALSRAHRIGQKHSVLCFQLMTKDSVEERTLQLGRKKMALDHALIEKMDDEDLAGDDLESILRHGAQTLFREDHDKSTIHYDSSSIEKLLDRTQMARAELEDRASTSGPFTQVQVWDNKAAGLGGLDTAESEAPEPIGSSVWDRILAQREEDAKRKADAENEVLGRGGRRRVTANYQANAPATGVDEPSQGEPDPGVSSDSSEEYAGGNSAESEGEATSTKGDDAEYIGEVLRTSTPFGDTAGDVHKEHVSPRNKHGCPDADSTKRKPRRRRPPKAKAVLPQSSVQILGRGQPMANPSIPFPSRPSVDVVGHGQPMANPNFAVAASGFPCVEAVPINSQHHGQPFQVGDQLMGNGLLPPWSPNSSYLYKQPQYFYPAPVSRPPPYFPQSEAELRLSIDEIWHSNLHYYTKQVQIRELLAKLPALSAHWHLMQQPPGP